MWPGEREALQVWADELQAGGDPLGDVIALHLRADEIEKTFFSCSAVAGDPEQASERAEILRAAEAARLGAIEHLLGPAIGELPRLRLRWQLGVVRGVYLDTAAPGHPPAQLVLEVVGKLLRRPVLRFLDDLQLEALVPDMGFERALLDELGSPEVIGRPRRIVLGPMPRSFRQQLPMRQWLFKPAREAPLESLEAAVARGLSWYGLWSRVQPLPWAPGDHGSRVQQLERWLARPWTDAHAERIAASLWDTSLAVRRCALEALPELPDALARALPSVLALELHGARVFGDLAQICANRIAIARPEWVQSISEEFCSSEPWIAIWLSRLGRDVVPVRRTVSRILSMIHRLASSGGHHAFHIGQLATALGNFGETASSTLVEPIEDETIAELLTKLGRHREL